MKEPREIQLASFQQEVVNWWHDNDHRGVIAFPLGLGGTLTAQTALAESSTPVVTVVVCGTLSEVETMTDIFTDNTVVELSPHGVEQEAVKSRIEELRTGSLRSIVFVATIQSWKQYEIQSQVANLGEVTVQLFIPDVDRFSDSHLARLSDLNPDRTLGISMIPEDRRERFGAILDQGETQKVLFNNNIYSYPLVEAIKDRFLRPFRYYPIIARSKQSEMDSIQDKIDTAMAASGESKRTAIYRAARARRQAGNRVELTSQLVQRNPPTPAVLICNEIRTGKQILEMLQNQGYSSAMLSAELTQSERGEILEACSHGDIEYLVATVASLEMHELDAIESAVIVSSTQQGLAEYRCLNRVLMGSEWGKASRDPVDIYEIVTFPHEKATTESVAVKQILQDAINLMRILIDASVDRHNTEYRLYRQLEEFEFGHLVYEKS